MLKLIYLGEKAKTVEKYHQICLHACNSFYMGICICCSATGSKETGEAAARGNTAVDKLKFGKLLPKYCKMISALNV